MFSSLSHYSLDFVLLVVIVKVNTITKKNECALRYPYQTRAKTKIMSEIEEVQEKMKADMEVMKDQMTSMMEAMFSMRWMMENNAAAAATTRAATDANLTHPFGLNQISHPIPDMVCQGGEVLGSMGCPHMLQNKNSFTPYDLPPNYTPPNAVHMPNKNANHSIPVPLEGQKPQLGHAPFAQPMREAHEEPQEHALGEFEPYPTMLLRDQHLVACLSTMPWEPLNTAHCNLCTSRWGDCLQPWKKGRSWIS